MTSYRRPTIVATLVLSIGVLASIAGNLQAINLDNESPGIGAYISAVFWPLALFVIIELLLHTPWLDNWRDRLTKVAAVLLVAGVGAWVSYWHLANVLSSYGYDVASRYAGPLAIDAAMVLATLALNRVGQARRMASVSNVQADVLPMDTLAEDIRAGVDRAQTELGQELAEETEHYLQRLAGQLDATTTPAVPVIAGPTELPRRAKVDVDEALQFARIGRTNGLSAGDIAELLGGWYGTSSRTIRRIPGWTLATASTEVA